MLLKNKKPFLLLIFLLFTFAKPMYAQTNNIRTEYREEQADKSDFTFKDKYQYFTHTHIEEKTLFKIGIAPVPAWRGSRLVGRFTSSFAFEKKIKPSLSYLLEIENRLSYTQGPDIVNDYALGLNGAFRYYYAINKRIKEGRSADNFSNNYFSIQSTNYILNRSRSAYGSGSSKLLSLLWGVQKRMGSLSYIDFNVGPSMQFQRGGAYGVRFVDRVAIARSYKTWWVPTIDVNFAIGFAL